MLVQAFSAAVIVGFIAAGAFCYPPSETQRGGTGAQPRQANVKSHSRSDPLASPRIMDDGDAGFSTTGEWSHSPKAGFRDDALAAKSGQFSAARWTFNNITPGYRYRVSATWPAGANQATAARYSITAEADANTRWLVGGASVDQTLAPKGPKHAGAVWQDIGEPVLARGTALSVRLFGGSDETIVADAVRIERIGEWQPPIGIAAPPFGIDESHWAYADREIEYDYGDGPEPYRIGSDGPYTHYVDNTHPQATDIDNDFGSPDRPRKTLPFSIPAGSVAEIHGGPYTHRAGGLSFTADASADRPAYVRGTSTNRPIIQMTFSIAGRYVIVENLQFDGYQVNLSGRPDHISLRNLEVRNFDPSGNNNAVNTIGSYLVVYRCHIHHNGDARGGFEHDVHGAKPRGDHIWIVDNHMHHNGGDSVQVKGARNDANDAQYIYIGRNVMHDDRENAIDIKGSRNVFVSQNVMYGYRPTRGEGSDGSAIVGAHEKAELGWFLFNEIYDCNRGIRFNEKKVKTQAYVIGNIFHDIDDVAIYARRRCSVYVVNNVVYKSNRGFRAADSDVDCYLFNNIFHDLNFHVAVERPARSESHHNIYYRPGGKAKIQWGKKTYYGLDSFVAATGQGNGSLAQDPKLVNPGGNDVRVAEGSPAIDAGADVEDLGELFKSQYGLDIVVDFLGRPRPQGAKVDIGAYEGAADAADPGAFGGGVTTRPAPGQ